MLEFSLIENVPKTMLQTNPVEFEAGFHMEQNLNMLHLLLLTT